MIDGPLCNAEREQLRVILIPPQQIIHITNFFYLLHITIQHFQITSRLERSRNYILKDTIASMKVDKSTIDIENILQKKNIVSQISNVTKSSKETTYFTPKAYT